MASSPYVTRFSGGPRLVSGDDLNVMVDEINAFLGKAGSTPQPVVGSSVTVAQGGQLFSSNVDNLSANSGTVQAGATPLTQMNNRVSTVGGAGYSVLLPPSVAGLSITVTNAAATNAMNVFPVTGDAINALSANAAFSVVAGKTCEFICYTAGVWHTLLSA